MQDEVKTLLGSRLSEGNVETGFQFPAAANVFSADSKSALVSTHSSIK